MLEGLEGVEPIAHNILVIGSGDSKEKVGKDRDAGLVALHHSCQKVKLWLSVKMLHFKVSEVHFNGHILSAAGLKADPEKLKAVLNMLALSDIKGV